MFRDNWHFGSVRLCVLVLLAAIVTQWTQERTNSASVSQARSQRKSLAVVIPFVAKDLDSLVLTLTDSVAPGGPSFPPCNKTAAVSKHNVDLILYTTLPIPHNSPLIHRLKWLERICFRQVLALTVTLPPHEDIYPIGPSAMFFALFHEESFLSRYDYMFWHEHDVHACRPYWLDKLYETAIQNPQNTWIRGSMLFQNAIAAKNEILSLGIGEHINGNALYSSHDLDFRRYITELVEPSFWNRTEQYLSAFDLAIEWTRRDRMKMSFVEFAETSSKFQYHGFIENWYRTSLNMTKRCAKRQELVFIHGRYLYR